MTSLDTSLGRFNEPCKKQCCRCFNMKIFTYSFFFDVFLFGLSPSESLLPWMGRRQRFTQHRHLVTMTTRWNNEPGGVSGAGHRTPHWSNLPQLQYSDGPVLVCCGLTSSLHTHLDAHPTSAHKDQTLLESHGFHWYLPFYWQLFHIGFMVYTAWLFCWQNKRNPEPSRVTTNILD